MLSASHLDRERLGLCILSSLSWAFLINKHYHLHFRRIFVYDQMTDWTNSYLKRCTCAVVSVQFLCWRYTCKQALRWALDNGIYKIVLKRLVFLNANAWLQLFKISACPWRAAVRGAIFVYLIIYLSPTAVVLQRCSPSWSLLHVPFLWNVFQSWETILWVMSNSPTISFICRPSSSIPIIGQRAK